MEDKQCQTEEVLSTPLSISLYILWVAFWALMMYYDYTHIVPYLYNTSSFWFNAGLYGEPYSLVWVLSMFAALFAVAPLRQGKMLGLLGGVLFVVVLLKPFTIAEVPRQTAKGFIVTHQVLLEQIVQAHAQPKASQTIDMNREVTRLGFDNFYVSNGLYHFSSLAGVGESAGFLWAQGDLVCPYRYCQKVAKNWYVYSTD
ncbi:hypothetical protein [Microscilla marina]|uniref:Uncharacterized protein n=1 Tax=Microscilla marina ATCC 23134 TaxID=313606 RepID=A1ZD13_MICM2|nr:hypothetical protein [Microscilla marina]EAY31552.1 hypothetical protein M23134_05058 [Microscilla marina ATCC 23134]